MANELAESVIGEAKSYLEVPYVLGGLSRKGIDCRGLVRKAFGNVGLRDLIGGSLPNVRAFVAWAKANGRFREPAGYTVKRGDVIFYANNDGGGAGPDHLQHMGIVLKPRSPNLKKGRHISAVVPEVMVLTLDPFKTLDIYGYLEPDWASAAEPPITDPEPPVGEDT